MTATRSPTEREGEGSNPRRGRRTKLFSLPGGSPALFLLRDFDNPNLAGRINEHGGRVTDDEAAADVILTRSREEYRSLKDRCIAANRFVLAPIPGKRLPGRIPGARRVEYTQTDDEQLCQYIAEVLPESDEGGRTGHFIYDDLMRRADQYGQYVWAQRHTKSSWRERYRKNQGRLDQRIAEIVHENPPAPDGKGQYKFRRRGRFDDEDGEDYALDLEAEANNKSSTDDDGDSVLAKRPQKEEEEEEEEEYDPRHQDKEEEEGEEAGRLQASASPVPPPTRRKGRVHKGKPPAPKRRRKAAASQEPEEKDRDPDQTLLDEDELAQESGIPPDDGTPLEPEPESEPEIPTRVTKRRTRAQPVSPRRTRASTRLRSVNTPEGEPLKSPAARRRRAAAVRAKATSPAAPTSRARMRSRTADATVAKTKKSKSGAAAPSLDPVAESANDEFRAHSEDEGDMQEVEGTLGEEGEPRRARNLSLSSDDMQTSKRLRRARADHDDDEADEDDDDSDAELLAQVKKLNTRPRPSLTPARARRLRRQKLNRMVEESESDQLLSEKEEEEEFPSPGTRAQAGRSRRTPRANVAPPSQGTRAATKGKGKARETAPHRHR